MGKEWHWSGRSSKRGGADETESPSPGCMCAVFQFFDFHPFHVHINQQDPSLKPSDEHSVPRGAEAPRNSLESEDGTMSSVSKEEILKIPKNIKIKTSGSTRSEKAGKYVNDSEISSSPSAKTPTLVARLMGLDLLPDAQSPSFSSSLGLSTTNPRPNSRLHFLNGPRNHIQTKPRNSTDNRDIVSSRSLPETPRISLARKSDVDYHHRLSLQINKENVNVSEQMEMPRFSFSKRKLEDHSSRSPSHSARQIVKQVKESVSRKVGIDITNTVRNREQARERDELVSQYRTNISPKASLKVLDESNPGKQSAIQTCSPKLRTTAPSSLAPKDQSSHPVKPPPTSRVLTKPNSLALQQQELQNQKQIPKCKIANEKFSPRLKKPPQTSDIMRNKQKESFVRPQPSTRANDNIKTKIKKTHSLPLSSNLLNLNTNLLPVKADSSPAATKIPQKESQVSGTQESKCSSQLSSCLRQTYKQQATCILATRETNDQDKSNGATTGDEEVPEFKYIRGMLKRTAVDNGTLASFTNWFSPTQPSDPSIFHHLEQDPPTISTSTTINNNKDRVFNSKNQLGLRCNRRLIFDLVDELLVEILMPRAPWGSWHSYNYNIENIRGSQLIETLWKKVQGFPRAKCEVLEDIDVLIEEEDMPKMKLHDAEAMEEEVGRLVAEIEGDTLDTIVHETVMDWCDHFGGSVPKGRRRMAGGGSDTLRGKT